jgi:hypothetical protein
VDAGDIDGAGAIAGTARIVARTDVEDFGGARGMAAMARMDVEDIG